MTQMWSVWLDHIHLDYGGALIKKEKRGKEPKEQQPHKVKRTWAPVSIEIRKK